MSKYYYEYEDVSNPTLNARRHLDATFRRNGKLSEALESDFRRSVMQNMREDEVNGWARVEKVRVVVWYEKDGEKIGKPIFDFTFKPDEQSNGFT